MRDKKVLVVIPVAVENEHHPDCDNHPNNRGKKSGPSTVVTDDYRKGWDAINWGGKRQPVGQA